MASPKSKILEVSLIQPISDSPESATEFSLPLTFLDLFWLRFPPVERLFFYKLTDSTPAFFNSVILPKLKHSLSLTLLHYLPLAGQIIWPPNSSTASMFYAPNNGVQLTVAESEADIDHLSKDEIRFATELHPYVPELLISTTTASVIALQITLFPNKGFSIGYTINHAVLDGTSITNFMKAWAYISKHDQRSLPPELSPFYNRDGLKNKKDLGSLLLAQWEEITQSKDNPRSLKVMPSVVDRNRIRSTFKLSVEDLKKIKNKILSELGNNNPIDHLSNFVATCAYVVVCMVKSKGTDDNRKVMFLFNVDARTRLNPPLPTNYFGNCVVTHGVNAVARDFKEENILSVIAKKISQVIKGLEINGVLKGIEEVLSSSFKSFANGAQVISVAGSTRFGVYGCDFGWGRPEKVEVLSIDGTGAISLNEGRDGNGGVEIGVAMTTNEMEIFASLFDDGIKDLY